MITSVTGFGLFVELVDIYVEGLVHVTALPGDYYQFDAIHHRLSGERSGRSYRLGDRIEVIVARVDLDERKIDFEMATADSSAETPAGKTSKVRKRLATTDESADQDSETSTKKGKGKSGSKARKRKVVSKSVKAGHYE